MIGKINSNVNFRAIHYNQTCYDCMRASGSSRSDIKDLKYTEIHGRDATMYYEIDQGYYLFTRGRHYYLGSSPTADDVRHLAGKIEEWENLSE